jgi:hypothetical protein
MCAMIALGLASTAISAAGMVMQGKQAEAMSEYQAKAYGQQAAADQQASAYEASRERHKQELLQAQARAQVGASGVALQAIRYGSQLRQNNLNTQAAIARFSGKQAKTASYIGAAGTAVSGFMSTYERAVQFGQNPFSG